MQPLAHGEEVEHFLPRFDSMIVGETQGTKSRT